MYRFTASLLLLLVATAAIASASSTCTDDGIDLAKEWCSYDTHCATLYRPGRASVNEAIEYFVVRARAMRPLPYMPVELQTLGETPFDVICNTTTTGPAVNDTRDAVVNALIRYGGFLSTSAVGCNHPHETQVNDPETGQIACVCNPGSVCDAGDDSSASTMTPGYTMGLAATIYGAVMVVAAIAFFTYRNIAATAALNLAAAAVAETASQ